jgi:hypothetical protein
MQPSITSNPITIFKKYSNMKLIVPSTTITTLLLATLASTSPDLHPRCATVTIKFMTFKGAGDPTVFVPLIQIQPTEINVKDPVYAATIRRSPGYKNEDIMCQLYEDVEGLKEAGPRFHVDKIEDIALAGMKIKSVRCGDNKRCGALC